MSPRIAFIISHFPRRNSVSYLQALIEQLVPYGQTIIVVENSLSSVDVASQSRSSGVFWLKRENSGMNIGAWRAGYENYSDFDYFFFFQAESFVFDAAFLAHYMGLFASDPLIGLIGDSVNLKWNFSWDALEVSDFNRDVLVQPNNFSDLLDQQGSVPLRLKRVSYYRQKLEGWGIRTSGQSAVHLRALNWCATKEVMRRIQFPIGFSKHECIAAEIAVSRAVIQSGFKICQSAKHPFQYIGHPEWDANGKVQAN